MNTYTVGILSCILGGMFSVVSLFPIIFVYCILHTTYKKRNQPKNRFEYFNKRWKQERNEMICSIIIFTLWCSLFISLSYVGYIQALDDKEAVLDRNSARQCNYTFIDSRFCNDVDCQVYTFELRYFTMKKEFVVKCENSQECIFPKYNSMVKCYRPDEFQTFSYRYPNEGYNNPDTLLVGILLNVIPLAIVFIISIVFIVWMIYYDYTFKPVEGEPVNDRLKEVRDILDNDRLKVAKDLLDRLRASTSNAPDISNSTSAPSAPDIV